MSDILSISSSLNHICHTCGILAETKACSECFSSYYCSKDCQTTDWRVHKIFCVKVDKNSAQSRRRMCLETIKSFQYAVYEYLFRLHVGKQKGYLQVSNSQIPIFILLKNFRKDPKFSHKKFLELSHAIDVTIIHKGETNITFPVLFVHNDTYTIYALGSKEISSQISPLSYICHTCQKLAKKHLCGRCGSTSYCSIECQKTDWKSHKNICEIVDSDIGESRRKMCKETIENFPYAIYEYLFLQKVTIQKSYLAVFNAQEPFITHLHHFDHLVKLDKIPSDYKFSMKKFAKLSLAIDLTIRKVDGKIHSIGIPVLFVHNGTFTIYTFGSQNISKMAQLIQEMPQKIAEKIASDSINDLLVAALNEKYQYTTFALVDNQ